MIDMNAQEAKLLETVDSLADDIVDFTIRLVAEPSTLGKENGATTLMHDELEKLGFDVTRIPLQSDRLRHHPGYAPVLWDADDRFSVVGTLPAHGSIGKSALFNGHLDVVDPGKPEFWSRDPFKPAIIDGWLYGRGGGDMKSGVAAMTYAAHAVQKAGFGLGAPFTLTAVIEEECSGNGAVGCLAEGFDGKAVLIPEPFGPTILTDQMGVLWFRVCLSGKSTHVLDARGGINAIEMCYPLMVALRQLEDEMNDEVVPEPFRDKTHPINLNIGIIEGGDWPSTVPSDAAFHARLSFFPHTGYEETCQQIRTTIDAAVAQDPWLKNNPPQVEFYGFRSEGHNLSRDLPALKTLNDCHHSLCGSAAESYIATCTTDLRAYIQYGIGQATCYGPIAENIHGPDERVNLESVLHVARTYSLFLARWCQLID